MLEPGEKKKKKEKRGTEEKGTRAGKGRIWGVKSCI